MKYEYELVISRYMGVNPIVINSSLVSAQNRVRNYWTNINSKPVGMFGDLEPDIPQPKDLGILVVDILESNVNEKYYLKNGQLEWWNKNKEFQIKKCYSAVNPLKAITLTARAHASWNGNYIVYNMSPRSGDPKKGGTGHLQRQDGKAYCLQTTDVNRIEYGERIRKFTEIECERLQTVPDNYTSATSSSQRYKMLGNGWTVDVICHILSFLK